MANLKNVIYLSNEDYETLVSTGTVTIDGETLTYDENNVYITPDKLASTTEDGLMSAADKSKLDNIESGAQVNIQADWNQTDIGADDYIKNKPEVDTDFSLTSTNALQNKVISEKLEYIDYALTHIKYKLFGVTALSEVDHKVDYATIYPIPDTLSDDDGTHRVVYSDTQLKEIEGNSFAFNQLLKYPSITSTTTAGLTITNNNDGSITISGTYTGTGNKYITSHGNVQINKNQIIVGHKYLKFTNQNIINSYCTGPSGFTFNSPDGIYTITETNQDNFAFVLVIPEGASYTTPVKVMPQIFDLTQMFGAGNEPTTVEEAKAELLKRGINVDEYNEFNAGEIRSTVIKGVKVNGYNALSLDRTTGTLSGLNEPRSFDVTKYYKDITRTNLYDKDNPRVSNVYLTNNSLLFSTNSSGYGIGMPVNVLPNTAYTFSCNVTTQNGSNTIFAISYYDKDGNYISNKTIENTSSTKSLSVTTPNNAKTALLFFSGWADAGLITYSNICFHLTGSRTGYAPYKEPRIIEIPQTELLSADSVHDTIKIVEGNVVSGQQRYNMVHVSRVASDDLGTLDWVYVGTSYNAYAQLPNGKKVPTSVLSNMLCSNYKVYREDDITAQTKGISFANVLIIKDTSLDGKTAEEIKTAMSGVILNYEKNEYTETTLATDLTFEEVSAIIEQGGSIETVFEIVPPNLKTAFVVNKVIVS